MYAAHKQIMTEKLSIAEAAEKCRQSFLTGDRDVEFLRACIRKVDDLPDVNPYVYRMEYGRCSLETMFLRGDTAFIHFFARAMSPRLEMCDR